MGADRWMALERLDCVERYHPIGDDGQYRRKLTIGRAETV